VIKFPKSMFIASFGFVLIGLGFSIHSYLFVTRGVVVRAEIVDLKRKIRDDQKKEEEPFALVFIFKDQKNMNYRGTSKTYTKPALGKIGDFIEIIYDPLNPENAELNLFLPIWGMGAFFGIAGVAFMVFSGLILLFNGPSSNKAPKNLTSNTQRKSQTSRNN